MNLKAFAVKKCDKKRITADASGIALDRLVMTDEDRKPQKQELCLTEREREGRERERERKRERAPDTYSLDRGYIIFVYLTLVLMSFPTGYLSWFVSIS